LIDNVNELKWTGATPAFRALADRLDAAVTKRPR
jgi:hypothetical protein